MVLRRENRGRWRELFDRDLGIKDNHWHIVMGQTSDGMWVDFGDIHEQLQLAHVISSYFPERETNVFAVGIRAGDQEHSGGYPGYGIGLYSEKPRGLGRENEEPRVSIKPDGMVEFNL